MKMPPRMSLYRRAQGKCGICGEDVARSYFHVDHILPRSKGGDNSIENLQITHAACNMRKGAKINGVRIPKGSPMLDLAIVKAAADDVSLHYIKLQGAIEVRNRVILKAYQSGEITLAELAKVAGLSHQRIHQLVYNDHEDDNESH